MAEERRHISQLNLLSNPAPDDELLAQDKSEGTGAGADAYKRLPLSAFFLSSNYETGTFTPTLSFGGTSTGITYSVQSGAYTRIGNKLFYEIDLRISSKGSASGQARIHGLPFTVFGNWGLSWVRWTNTATALVAMNALAEGGGNQYISLAGRTAAGTGGVTLLTNNDFAENTILLLTGFYTIA